jgi:CPA2 family monovalent cation:H+ antiporter-2
MSAMVMMGVLVAEDLFVVFILSLITSIVSAEVSLLPSLGWVVFKIVLFMAGTLIIGILFIPRIIDRVNRVERDEVLILIAVGLCFGLSFLSNTLGLSLAIGAFLMGVLIATAKSKSRVATLTSPIKDMFAAMFFVSMGALIDVTQFKVFLIPALIVTVMMMVGKILGCGFGARIFGYDTSTSVKVGLGMGQIGEFAFIVAKAGQDLHVVGPTFFPVIGVAAALTAFTTPYMIKLSFRLAPDFTPFRYPFKRRLSVRIVKPGPPKQPQKEQ